jgi:uncharacterized Zn-finger protein
MALSGIRLGNSVTGKAAHGLPGATGSLSCGVNAGQSARASYGDTDAMSDSPIEAPETEEVTTRRIACDGGGVAYGHPRVWLQIGAEGFVECPYCDKKFVLAPGTADH